MAVSLTHTTQAVGTDAGNGEIGKTQWNEEHTLTLGTGKLIGRTTAGTGAAEEISAGTGLTLSSGTLSVTSGTYAAASHSHAISDITSLQTTLDGKAASSHTHTLSHIADAGTAAASDATDFASAGAVTTSGLTMATARLLGRTTASSGAVEEISAGTGLSLSGGSLAVADNARTSAIGYTIDGGGSAIATGIAGMGLVVPYACTIVDWTLLADVSGAIKIDVWKDTYANFPPTNSDSITNGNEPEITASGVKAQDTDLSNWTTTSVSAGDILYFNVDSCATITKALLVFKVVKT